MVNWYHVGLRFKFLSIGNYQSEDDMKLEDLHIEFKVSPSQEAKDRGEFEEVKFLLRFPDTCLDQLVSDGIAHQKVKWQQQIRSHWDKFVENGVPAEIEYGQPLFGGRQGVRPPTKEEMANYMAKNIARLTKAGIEYLAVHGNMPEETDEYYKNVE